MKFMAIFYGGASPEEKAQHIDEKTQQAFMNAWMEWATANKDSILDNGTPLSNTIVVDQNGASDTENHMTAYAIVQAESHERAVEMFKSHPHLTLHPKNRIEVVVMKSVPQPE